MIIRKKIIQHFWWLHHKQFSAVYNAEKTPEALSQIRIMMLLAHLFINVKHKLISE